MRSLAYAVALAALIAGCGGVEPERSVSRETSSPPATAPTPRSPSPTAAPALDWRPVTGPAEDVVTVSGEWELRVDADRRAASLSGPRSTVVEAGRGRRIGEALIDGEYALVVSLDEREERPAVATVVHLASGETLELTGRGEVPTTTGGTWALGGGRVLYATYDRDRYCLAMSDPASARSEVAWCAPERTGFSNARVGSVASMLTFDAGQPSCRTVVTLGDAEPVPFDGVPECRGWEGVVLPDGSRVWSVIPDENRIADARFHASDGTDLGPGKSGSLVACGDAAYFARDPDLGEPARIVRWEPGAGRSVVYEASGGARALVSAPRCGGSALTITALTESGDEQVWASVE